MDRKKKKETDSLIDVGEKTSIDKKLHLSKYKYIKLAFEIKASFDWTAFTVVLHET